MKSFLIATALLLLSTLALANETTLAISGLTVKKDQVVFVKLVNSKFAYLHGFHAPTDFSANDEVNVVFEDVVPGEYVLDVIVRESDVGKIVSEKKLRVKIEG